MKTHIWQEGLTELEDSITASATIEGQQCGKVRLRYSVPLEFGAAMTASCDPFVLGAIFTAMRGRGTLCVHGTVSPSLLRNLDEFQAAWSCWRPYLYTKIEIVADTEKEYTKEGRPNRSVVAFSGGADSCFTVWRHRTGKAGRQNLNISAGLVIQGFDIPLGDNEAFGRATQKCSKILASLGVKTITMATNFRELSDEWNDAHGSAVASCLSMLQGSYESGLIASSPPYDKLKIALPWGSNPLTDPLLSNESFAIVHDGASFSRHEKIRLIATWPEAAENMRVCWEGELKDRNCGRCEKCIRTVLSFRAAGFGLPDCFAEDVGDEQIAGLQGLTKSQIFDYTKILESAKAAYIKASWVGELEKCLRRHRREPGIAWKIGQKIKNGLNLLTRSGPRIRTWSQK